MEGLGPHWSECGCMRSQLILHLSQAQPQAGRGTGPLHWSTAEIVISPDNIAGHGPSLQNKCANMPQQQNCWLSQLVIASISAMLGGGWEQCQ